MSMPPAWPHINKHGYALTASGAHHETQQRVSTISSPGFLHEQRPFVSRIPSLQRIEFTQPACAAT